MVESTGATTLAKVGVEALSPSARAGSQRGWADLPLGGDPRLATARPACWPLYVAWPVLCGRLLAKDPQ